MFSPGDMSQRHAVPSVAPSQNPPLVAVKHRTLDDSLVLEGLDQLVRTHRPEPGRPIAAPSQNFALVATKHRAIDRSLVHEFLDRFGVQFVRVQRPKPGRLIIAPSQNPALVLVKRRALNRSLVLEALDRLFPVQRYMRYAPGVLIVLLRNFIFGVLIGATPALLPVVAAGAGSPKQRQNLDSLASQPSISRSGFDRRSLKFAALKRTEARNVNLSVPALQLGPHLIQGPFGAPTIEHVKVLGWHRVGMIDIRYPRHACETVLEPVLPALQHDDALAGKVARSPEEVVLVATDGLW
jgi:hypothetical protein